MRIRCVVMFLWLGLILVGCQPSPPEPSSQPPTPPVDMEGELNERVDSTKVVNALGSATKRALLGGGSESGPDEAPTFDGPTE